MKTVSAIAIFLMSLAAFASEKPVYDVSTSAVAGSYLDLANARIGATIENAQIKIHNLEASMPLKAQEGELAFDSGPLNLETCDGTKCYQTVRYTGRVFPHLIGQVYYPHLKILETRMYPGIPDSLNVVTRLVSAEGAKIIAAQYRQSLREQE